MIVQRRPWVTQPKIPARIDPASGLRPALVLLPGFGTELATGKQWTSAGGSTVLRANGLRAFDPGTTANALTRGGETTTAQTKVTFVAVINRAAANAFAEIMGMSSNGTGFNLGYDGGGASVGIRKTGVLDLATVTPAAAVPVVLIASHDQTTGDYYILSRELYTGVELRNTQNDTSASTAGNGTVSINRNGTPFNFADSIFLGVAAYQYKPESWARRYLANPWALFEPQVRRIWVSVPASAGASAALTGSSATSTGGTVVPSSTVALSGSAATASAGAATPTAEIALSGQVATSSAGTVTPNITVALTGQEATASAGTLTPTQGATAALTGQEATSSAGTLGVTSANVLAGAQSESATGTLGLNVTVALTGAQATATAGTLTPTQNDITVSLSGQAATAFAGTLGVANAADLAGSLAVTSAGTLTAVGGTSAVRPEVGGGDGRPRRRAYEDDDFARIRAHNNQIIQALMAVIATGVLDEEWEEAA